VSYVQGVMNEAPTDRRNFVAKHGLPVPTVLAGPVIDPTQPDAGVMTLLNVLPGQDLLSWFWNASAEEVEHALRLALEGVERLHLLTEPLQQEPLAQPLPHRTLHMELQELIAPRSVVRHPGYRIRLMACSNPHPTPIRTVSRCSAE
jgi:hypothetical protein